MLRKILKWFSLGIGAVLLLVAALAVNVIWFKPITLNLFFERTFLQYGLDSPQALTAMGLFDGFPIKFYQDELDEVSVERIEELNAWLRESLHTLRRYDRENYEGQKALSYDIFEWFLEKQVEGQKWTWHGYPVNQMYGIHTGLPDFMLQMHPVRGERDVDFYLARLRQFPAAFEGTIEVLEKHRLNGVIAPRFAVEKPLETMKDFARQPVRENPLYAELLAKVDALEQFPPERRESLPAELEAVIEAHVRPAYEGMIAYFESLLPQARDNHGVWSLPDGEAYYTHLVSLHTTTDYTPARVHEIGLSEVARIEREMDALLCEQGYCDGSVGARMTALNAEPRFLFEDSDAGRARILAEFRAIIEEAEEGLDDWFDLRPEAAVEVRRVPEFSEEGSAGAYYQRPAMDGSRPGVFFVKLLNVDEHPRFGLRTLAYHEAIPGHHFQIALQQQIEGVPMFRRMLPFTAYSEGWALYAERVAHEAGLHPDPFSELGRLQAEMFRAVRLVVDTGMHHQRWTRERAIDYMVEKTGMAATDVVAEVERYLVMPGQALAYKTGMMKILELRERARRKLGEAFDIRDFHRVVLMNGSMPLGILERVVDEWIAETRAGSGRRETA
ncbi:MAG: DUF885 domain-containing protein [Wenzhouxiangellaceae bacterium]|nr:DUF885 domain-containing protein [Wenzhouxiangellaceae bacterium]